MKVVHTTGVAALAMLRRTREEPASPQVTPLSLAPQDTTQKNPLAAGQGSEAKARAAATEALFGVNRESGEKLLIRRIEQLGQVLGVDRSDYGDFDVFIRAVKDVLIQVIAKPNGAMTIETIAARMKLDPDTVAALKAQKTPDMLFRIIEKHLGLDRLGLSLDRLVTAAQDLQGAEAETIIEILLRDRALSTTGGAGQAPVLVRTDEAGLYRVAAKPGA